MNEQLAKAMIQRGPIPGQSLVTDPENPAPYEKPPQFTTVHAASEEIFGRLIEREIYIPLIDTLADGMPIMDIAQSILFKGFTEGKWTPSLMMLLIEPTAYMILALAERAGLDPVIYRGEDEDEEMDNQLFGQEVNSKKLAQLKDRLISGRIPSGVITPEMEQTLEALPSAEEVQGLMAQQNESEAPSLMAAPTAPTEEEVMQ